MIKKTVYDELLSYKIPEDDVKKIADSFIFAQKSKFNISLEDIIFFYKKKVDIERFNDIMQNAGIAKIEIPFSDFKKSKLIRNDFINLFDGWFYAEKNKLKVSIGELEIFAKTKINLIKLIDALLKLRKYDKDISLKDFLNCNIFYHKTGSLVDVLIELKNIDPEISFKEIISLNYAPYEIKSLINIYKKFVEFKKNLTIKSLFLLKKNGQNVNNIFEAAIYAQENELTLNLDHLINIDKKGFDVKEIISYVVKPKTSELKPVSAILKNGLEILLKIKVKTIVELKRLNEGIDEEFLFSKVNELYKAEVHKFGDFREVSGNVQQISNCVYDNLKNYKTAYKILSISIEDIAIGKNVKLEEELQIMKIERKIAEEKALLTEAVLRTERAIRELKKIEKVHKKVK